MFKVDEHEQKINELSELLKVEGVDTAKASLIIQGLRDNYTEVSTSIENSTKELEKTKGLNEGLRSANMEILAKLGVQNLNNHNGGGTEEHKEDKKDDVLSIDDIANEFLK